VTGAEIIQFASLFEEFRAASWDTWRSHLARLTDETRELWAVAGRGSGKSRIAALLATYAATQPYKRVPGEALYVGVVAPDRRQAGVTFRYIVGLLRSRPELESLIVAERSDSLELRGGAVVEVMTASTVALRGRTYALLIFEESSFYSSDEFGSNQDLELLRSARPALARMPGSLLVVIGSPYARRGILWTAYQRYTETPERDVLLVHGTTEELNPTFDRGAVERARRDDPVAASSEYDAQFRSDIESYISVEALEAVIEHGVTSREWTGQRCAAFIDVAGGSGRDSWALAIGYVDHDGLFVLAALLEIRPKFSPDEAVRQSINLLRDYNVSAVRGDRYAGLWPRERFQMAGITYDASVAPKSDLYRDCLPLITAGRVRLLDVPRLKSQFVSLERRTSRGGKDSIDAPQSLHEDLANAVAGLLVELARPGWQKQPEVEGWRFGLDTPSRSRAIYQPGKSVHDMQRESYLPGRRFGRWE
jgi:hypothetical protein